MHIAIVDDDYKIIAQLTQYISLYYQDTEYEQDDYSNGMEFVRSLSDTTYHIVFMDIEMDFMNGIDATKKLRELDINESTYVIFITSHTDHLSPLFSFHPFALIEKPICQEHLFAVLTDISKRITQDKTYLPLTVHREKILICTSDIIYIQSDKHTCILELTENRVQTCHMKLNDLEEQLAEITNNFIRIHSSFLVNKQYISMIKKDEIWIKHKILPVSRKYRDTILTTYSKGELL